MTNEEIMKSFYSSDISFSELIDFGLTRKISINEELIDIEREKKSLSDSFQKNIDAILEVEDYEMKLNEELSSNRLKVNEYKNIQTILGGK